MKDETPGKSGGFVDGPRVTQTLSPKRSSPASAGGGSSSARSSWTRLSMSSRTRRASSTDAPVGSPTRQSMWRVLAGISTEPTLRPIVTITSAPSRTSGRQGLGIGVRQVDGQLLHHDHYRRIDLDTDAPAGRVCDDTALGAQGHERGGHLPPAGVAETDEEHVGERTLWTVSAPHRLQSLTRKRCASVARKSSTSALPASCVTESFITRSIVWRDWISPNSSTRASTALSTCCWATGLSASLAATTPFFEEPAAPCGSNGVRDW